jgi:hypothetical protein
MDRWSDENGYIENGYIEKVENENLREGIWIKDGSWVKKAFHRTGNLHYWVHPDCQFHG